MKKQRMALFGALCCAAAVALAVGYHDTGQNIAEMQKIALDTSPPALASPPAEFAKGLNAEEPIPIVAIIIEVEQDATAAEEENAQYAKKSTTTAPPGKILAVLKTSATVGENDTSTTAAFARIAFKEAMAIPRSGEVQIEFAKATAATLTKKGGSSFGTFL